MSSSAPTCLLRLKLRTSCKFPFPPHMQTIFGMAAASAFPCPPAKGSQLFPAALLCSRMLLMHLSQRRGGKGGVRIYVGTNTSSLQLGIDATWGTSWQRTIVLWPLNADFSFSTVIFSTDSLPVNSNSRLWYQFSPVWLFVFYLNVSLLLLQLLSRCPVHPAWPPVHPCAHHTSQPCAGTIHQHDAHMGQKHTTNENAKTKLVPDLLFGELCHVPSSLAFPLSALLSPLSKNVILCPCVLSLATSIVSQLTS